MPLKIVFFASGSGTNVENIVRKLENDDNFEFSLILSNKSDAYVHQRAKLLNIESLTFSKDDFLNGGKILHCLKERNIDCVVLAGFLLRVPAIIIDAFPQKIINIHPALLPKYGGKGMYGHHVHEAVFNAKEKETGITIHYVNERYDDGNIILQKKCEINTEIDTPDTIAHKVHRLEYEYFPKAIQLIWSQNR